MSWKNLFPKTQIEILKIENQKNRSSIKDYFTSKLWYKNIFGFYICQEVYKFINLIISAQSNFWEINE